MTDDREITVMEAEDRKRDNALLCIGQALFAICKCAALCLLMTETPL